MVDTQASHARDIEGVKDRAQAIESPEVDVPGLDDGTVQRLLADRRPGLAGPTAPPPDGRGAPARPVARPGSRPPSAMLRSRDIVALQRMAGNSAVTGFLTRRARPVVQRAVVAESEEAVAEPEEAQGRADAERAGRPPRTNPKAVEAIHQWQAMAPQPAEPAAGAVVGAAAAGAVQGAGAPRTEEAARAQSGARAGSSAAAGVSAAEIEMPPMVVNGTERTAASTPASTGGAGDQATPSGSATGPATPGAASAPGPSVVKPASTDAGGAQELNPPVIEMPPMVITATVPPSASARAGALAAERAAASEAGATAAGTAGPATRAAGAAAAETVAAAATVDVAAAEIETPPVFVTGSVAGKGAEVGQQAEVEGTADGAGAATPGAAPGEIEMPPIVITAMPPGPGGHRPGASGRGGRSKAGAIGTRRPAEMPREIEMPPELITAAPPEPSGAPVPSVINMPPMLITASPPASARPTGVSARQIARRVAPAGTTDAGPARGFPEKRKPHAPSRRGTMGGPGKSRPHTRGAAHPGGRRGAGKAASGGAGGVPAQPPLHDPTLEKWRAAAAGAINATKPGDLSDAKDGPSKVEAKGKDIDSQRKAARPDFEADAKSKQPPMPAEPKKDAYLDTKGAETAVDAVVKAGDRKLTTQTLKPIDYGDLPAADFLTGADFVSGNQRSAIKDLEDKLANAKLTPLERAAMTKDLEARRQKVADIEAHALDAPPSQPPPSVVDQGAAKLTPPSKGEADLMGDAIAVALGTVDRTAGEILTKVEASMHGTVVKPLIRDADAEKPKLVAELNKELHGIAAAAGLTEEQLKAKIQAHKDDVKQQSDQVSTGIEQASVKANKQVEDRAKDEGRKIAGAKKAVQTEIEQKQQAVQGPPDTATIEKKRDEYLGRITDTGSQAQAALRAAGIHRDQDLDAAGAEQKRRIAQTADGRAAAIRRHFAGDTDPNRGMVEARPTVDWSRKHQSAVDTEVRRLKAAAKVEGDGFTDGVSNQVTASKESVRDWAAHQQGRERSWWDRLWDMIRDWGKQAGANNDAWEKQRNAESRDAMAGDFNALTDLRKAQVTHNGDALNEQFARLDNDQKVLAQKYLRGKISGIDFVAESTMARIRNRRAPELAKKLEAQAIASWTWEELGDLARGSNPKFNPDDLAAKVKGGVAGWGTKEDKVYQGLGGARTAVERAALAKCYQAKYHVSMEADVADDMGGHEMERAKALMEGKSAEADAATIKEAVAGWGTDEAAIRNALRGKTPEELDAIKAEYKRRYGVELNTDLADDMSGAELDNAVALSSGDVDKADAAELEDAMAGPGTDEDKIKKVYERIREEEEAKAKREGLTPGELQQRIRERNARVRAKYGEKYGNLEANLRDELLDVDMSAAYGLKGPGAPPIDDSDMKLVDALQSGDAAKIDAAKAYREHNGVYASDDELEAITRNQYKRADLDVNLELGAEQARIKAMADSGDLSPEEYRKQTTALREKIGNKDAAIKARAQQNMGDLRAAYSATTGGSQTFDQLINEETSGYSQLEIQDLVAAGGKLSDEQELYYATAGIGTDEDKIKEVLKGKTPAEIKKLREAYAKKHPGHTLDDDILGDLSGREDLDIGHELKYGDPETFARQLEEEKDPDKRRQLLEGMKTMLRERKAFEETGAIGQAFALGGDPMNTAEQLEDAVKRAEDYDALLDKAQREHPGMTPADMAKDPDLVAAKANFEMNYGGTLAAQQEEREQIDAYADVAAQVGAAIAGIAVTVATLGTAGPVVAAIYGAVAAAASTMAIKSQLRGAAYSWEEAGVDLAVGTVDAAVSGLTAGLGKGVMQALEKAVAAQMAKEVAKEGAEKVTESAVKVWVKEAMEEAIENAVQGMPSAFVGSMLDDNTWKSDDPWGQILKATGQAGAMGAGMGVGIKGAKDLGGAAFGKIKGALKGEPRVEAGATPTGGGEARPETAAPSELPSEPGEPRAGVPEPNTQPPEVKPLDLPPEGQPGAAGEKALAGELPPEANGADLTKGGKLPDSAAPEPRASDVGVEGRTTEPEGRATAGSEKGTGGEAPTAADDAVITDLPDGSVAQLPDDQLTDRAANLEAFEAFHQSDPAREVALLRNDVTGEYVIVQGDRGSVSLGRDNPNWAKDLLSPEQLGRGEWVYEAHSHPIEAPGKATAELERWPSGGTRGGDFNGVAAESLRTGKKVSEELHYMTETGPEKLTYGYDPNAEKPYFIERPGPDGSLERHEFSTIDEYHGVFEEKFHMEPGGPIADNFPGAREPIDPDAPTRRPGELEGPPTKREGKGRASSEPSASEAPEPGARSLADTGSDTAPRGKPSAEDVGRTLTEADLAQRYGMPEANVRRIEAVCAEQGIIVDIRPTTPHAEPMLREGTALPKPEKVKAKTINETDVLIGLGKPDDLGKVGFFDPAVVEPHRPPDFESLPKSMQDKIDQRIEQRLEEFGDYQKDMQKLVDAGDIRIEPDGTVINTGLVPGGELPFTGDHDIFDIRARDGSPLTPEQYQAAKAALLAADAGVMHGGVTGWSVDAPETFNTPAGQKSYGNMMEAHSPGGKDPLVRLGDGEPKAVWYEPAAPLAEVAGADVAGSAPEPKLSTVDRERLFGLQDRLGDEGMGWEDVGLHSERDVRDFFSQFPTTEAAIADLERRAERAIDIRQTMGPAAAGPATESELGTRPEAWTGGRTSRTDRPMRDPWTAAREASEILGANLGPPPSPEGYHAHHIIPESEGGEGLEWLRDKLREADIGINSAENGVWLVGESGALNVAGTTPHTTYLHAGNRDDYLYTLVERLGSLEGPELARELAAIKLELTNGAFDFREAPVGWTPEDAEPALTSSGL